MSRILHIITPVILLSLLCTFVQAEANNPGIGIEGEIVVTPVVCPGDSTTATAKLKWPPTVTNRPSGTFTWKIVPTDLAAPPGGTSEGNDSSEATLEITSARATTARSFQVQVSWKGPPNYNMPNKTATVSIKRDESTSRGSSSLAEWTGGPWDAVDYVKYPNALIEGAVKTIFSGQLIITVRLQTGYTETIQAYCPGNPNPTRDQLEELRTLSRESADEAINNLFPALIASLLSGIGEVTTGGVNPISNPDAAVAALDDLAGKTGEAVVKAITDRTTTGVFVPAKNPPGIRDLTDEYDDVLAKAREIWVAEQAVLVQWELTNPQILVEFTSNKPGYTRNFAQWLLGKLTDDIPEPGPTIIEAWIRKNSPDLLPE